MSKNTSLAKFLIRVRPQRPNGGSRRGWRPGGKRGWDRAPLGGSSTCIDFAKKAIEVFIDI
jgi:hypothetical protein